MPYIAPARRRPIDRVIEIVLPNVTSPGDLNYAITRLCRGFLGDTPHSYMSLNEVIGVLECAKQEFYRTVAAPYEDRKRAENGDVT